MEKPANAPANMDEVAYIIAQQKAMERGGLTLSHGCRLFRTVAGWESAALRKDPDMRSCETLLDLEAALRDTETLVIFIPQGAMMTDEDIAKVCRRNGVTKTLFKEGEDE